MVGKVLAQYQISEKLGEGGMGVVWKARDTRLDRFVAIKVLHTEKLSDPERQRRFVQEAKAASALNHPNIVHIYNIAEADGVQFIAMEYVSGKTLDQLIGRKGLRLNEALKYAVQIADALAKAHSSSIVHRDLKPSNVMVNESGLVKVLDFGLAKLAETGTGEFGDTATVRTTEGQGTEEGTILGTTPYMSPEQAEGKKVDARSDIFSFGSVLYQMVTGRRAFHGDTKLSTLSAILKDEPKPASSITPDVPRDLEKIISRCMRKAPERRFQHMADVKVALEELKEDSDSGALGAAHASQRRRRPGRAWVVALLAVIGLGTSTLWFVRSRPKPPEHALGAVPLATYPGFQGEPSFSPDGNQVAFTWNGQHQDNYDIYVKLIGTGGSPLRLTTDPADDLSPAWSPDGRFIAFLRLLPREREKAAVLLIPALGGPERKLAEVLVSEFLPSPYVAWSPDGSWLVVSDRGSHTETVALFLLSVETGEKRRLTSPPAQLIGDSCPTFSPDGRRLAFNRSGVGTGDLNLLALSAGLNPVGDAKRLTFGNRAVAGTAWTADGREIVFSTGLGRTSLWRVSVPGPGEPQPLESLGENAFSPAISRGGRRLSYGHAFFHSTIWRMAAPGSPSLRTVRSLKPLNGASPLISSTRDSIAPQYSPDGKRIAFMSIRSGSEEIWICDSDGANVIQLTSFGGPSVTTPRWSPDGTKIAFDSTAAGEYDIWMVGANGGKPQRMTTHPADDANPSWSRDGRWIYFDSGRTGESQVWKIPANGGDAIQLTRDGGLAPLESPDGKFLDYVKSLAGTSLWKIPVEGGQATKILEGLSTSLNLAMVDSGLYFVPAASPGSGSSIQFLNFASHQISPVANFEKPLSVGVGGGLAVSPDGRWILYTQADQAGSELMLVENFQ